MDTADQITGKGRGIRDLHQRRLRILRSVQVGSGAARKITGIVSNFAPQVL